MRCNGLSDITPKMISLSQLFFKNNTDLVKRVWTKDSQTKEGFEMSKPPYLLKMAEDLNFCSLHSRIAWPRYLEHLWMCSGGKSFLFISQSSTYLTALYRRIILKEEKWPQIQGLASWKIEHMPNLCRIKTKQQNRREQNRPPNWPVSPGAITNSHNDMFHHGSFEKSLKNDCLFVSPPRIANSLFLQQINDISIRVVGSLRQTQIHRFTRRPISHQSAHMLHA